VAGDGLPSEAIRRRMLRVAAKHARSSPRRLLFQPAGFFIFINLWRAVPLRMLRIVG
jgi:hypothetical protein